MVQSRLNATKTYLFLEKRSFSEKTAFGQPHYLNWSKNDFGRNWPFGSLHVS